MYCIFIAIIVVYLLFFPLLLSDRPDDRCRRPCDRLRRRRPYPYPRASRKAEPFSSPYIAYLFRKFLPLGMFTAATTITIIFNCIACFCRPLMYLPLSYAALQIYIIF